MDKASVTVKNELDTDVMVSWVSDHCYQVCYRLLFNLIFLWCLFLVFFFLIFVCVLVFIPGFGVRTGSPQSWPAQFNRFTCGHPVWTLTTAEPYS